MIRYFARANENIQNKQTKLAMFTSSSSHYGKHELCFKTTKQISESVKKQLPNDSLHIKTYLLTARHVLLQIGIYRKEKNWPQVYRLGLGFISLYNDTIKLHRAFEEGLSIEQKKELRAQCEELLSELENLKILINSNADWMRKRDELVVPETSEGCTIVRPRSLVNDSDNSSTSAVISNASMKERFGSGFNGEAQRTKKHSLLSVGVLDDVGRESAYEAISEKVSGLSIYDNHDKDKDDYDANGLTRTNNNTTNNYDQSSNRNADEETINKTTNNNSSNYRQPLYSLLDDDDPPPPPSTPPHYNNEQYSSLKRDDSMNGVPTYDFVQSAASIEFRPSVVRAQPPTSTLANLDHQKLDKRLEHYGLKEFIVKGDGNCQFRAISDQLYNDQSHHASVRATTIAQMRNNRDRYAAFVEAPENGGFDAYLRDMSRDSAWGDHVTLQAAADAFGVPMCVITSYKDNFVIEIQPDRVKRNDRALWISFWSEVHYNSLYPIESSKFKNVHVGQR